MVPHTVRKLDKISRNGRKLTSCTACIDRIAGSTAFGTAIDFTVTYRVDGYGIL